MWFKNLYLYRLRKGFDLDAEALEQKLQTQAFRPCSALEMSTIGWVAPAGRKSSLLVHAANGLLLVTACRQDRLLPVSVIRDEMQERADKIEIAEDRPVRRREMAVLREEVTLELTPKALPRNSRINAYIDPKEGWLVVDASSSKRAEELVSLLRESVGTLSLALPETEIAPASILTGWLHQSQIPQDFELLDQCVLRDPAQENSVIRCRGVELDADEIQAHMRSGKQAIQLALRWADRLEFVMCDNLQIKQLRFLDIIQEQAADIAAETEIDRLDADFSIMTAELRPLLSRLIEICGGEASEESAA